VGDSLLTQLKDLHIPSPIYWPLAPGWYILLFFLLLILGSVAYYGYHLWKKRKKIKQENPSQWIHHELSLIEDKLKKQDPSTLIACSTLLRRVALLQYPRSDVASLTGEAWLSFLDTSGNTLEFTQGSGRLLITAPYQSSWHEETPTVFSLTKQWIAPCLK